MRPCQRFFCGLFSLSWSPVDSPAFPALFEAALRRKGWAQKRAAQELRRNPGSISMWLQGKTRPDAGDKELVARLAELLGIAEGEVRRLVGDEGPAAGPTSAPEDEVAAARGTLLFPDPKGIRRKLGQVYKYVPEKPLRRFDPATPDDIRLAAAMAAMSGEPVTPRSVEEKLAVLRLAASVPAELTYRVPVATGPVQTGQGLRKWAYQEGIRDRIRFLCGRLNQMHYAARGGHPPLLAEVIGNLEAELPEKAGSLVADLLAEAVNKRLARREGDRFVQNWDISSEYLINSCFGFSTGVDGLDFLFDGGLLPNPSQGLVMVLKGNYGRAKSTVALELACSLANQGHVLYYACFEESPEQVQERLSYIGYHTESRYSRAKVVRYEGLSGVRRFLVSSTNYISPEITGALLECARSAVGPGAGVLLFVDVPPPYHAFLDPSDELSSAIRNMKKPGGVLDKVETGLVVDSLEAVTEDDQRRTFQTFYDAQRLPRHMTILLRRDDVSVKDFLADIVIRLELRQLEDRGSERLITIEKCRTQNHRRGTHLFKVREHEGVTVYPSIHSHLTVWSRQDAVVRTRDLIPWKVEDLDFTAFLSGGFPRGHIGLLYGDRGSLSVSLGLSFLAAESQSRVAMFTFPEDEQRIIQELQNHAQFLNLLDGRGGLNKERMSVFHPKPDCDSAEEIFAWFRECLRSVSSSVERVVVNGLGTHISLAPRLREEMTLVRGVLALMRRKELSTLFLESNPALANGFDWRDHCDLVLRSRNTESDGSVVVTAERHTREVRHPVRVVRQARESSLILLSSTSGIDGGGDSFEVLERPVP